MKKVITLLLAMLHLFAADSGIVATAEELIIHFLDVGQADAAILQCSDEVLMIDGGESADSSLIYSFLKKTLSIMGIPQKPC